VEDRRSSGSTWAIAADPVLTIIATYEVTTSECWSKWEHGKCSLCIMSIEGVGDGRTKLELDIDRWK
jgi:hypothetical protein